jgi:hypothetical protein
MLGQHLRFRRFGIGTGLPALVLFLATEAAPAQALAGSTDQVLHQFLDGKDGTNPADLAADNEGHLFGVARSNGGGGLGTLFELTQTNGVWSFKTIYTFTGNKAGSSPGAVTVDAAGNLYVSVGQGAYGEIAQFVPNGKGGWKVGKTYDFHNGGDGAYPNKVYVDASGNVWGSTSAGGIVDGPNGNLGVGWGTVYELSPAEHGWTEHTIYEFTGNLDGAFPQTNLVIGRNGDVYGGEPYGGTARLGTIFKFHDTGKGWKREAVYTFTGVTDGGWPTGKMVIDRAGNIYGETTHYTSLVFRVAPPDKGAARGTPWTFTAIGNFGADGAAGVAFDSAGNLDGVAGYGGAGPCGCGYVFSLTPTESGAWNENVLWTFGERPDAGSPDGELVAGAGGIVYGVSTRGGQGYGTVYSVTP